MKSLDINFKNYKKNLTKNFLNKKVNVLYLNRNGLPEHLLRNCIIFYLRGLSVHYSVTLINNEIIK